MQRHGHDGIAVRKHVPSLARDHPLRHHRRKIGAVAIFQPMHEIARDAVEWQTERSRSKTGGLAIASADRMPAPRSCANGMPSTSQ